MSAVAELIVDDSTQAIESFRRKINESADAISEAAQIYYNAVISNPNAAKEFRDAFPSVSSRTWSNFLKLAQGTLAKSLVFNGSYGAIALSYCDPDTQEFYLSNPVPVALPTGDILPVHLDKLTGFQARQVFNHGAVRDIPEQRAWIETQKTRKQISQKQAIDKTNGVYVRGNKLHVGNLTFTKSDLARFLKMMEG